MKRILVIGAKGMLGRDLVEVLRGPSFTRQPMDWEVVGWDLEEIDIRNQGETIAKIESFRPDIVINLAAYTDVDGCEQDEEKAFLVNAEGMKHVALGALRSRAKVVYLSTDYVFDGMKREPYLEEDLPNPINAYGRSKWKGEQYLQEMAKDPLIIRTQWLYGRHGKNFVSAILRQAQQKKVLSIVSDQIGSPTYTVDLARVISVLVQFEGKGIFHVANSDLCSWYTYGQAILKLSKMNQVRVIPTSTKEFGRPAPRPAYSVLSTQKLKRETGIQMRPWSEALKEFLLTYPLPLGNG